MRNLLALIGLAVVAFFGVGYYMGWYKLAVQPGTGGTQRISLDVDTKKIAADVKTAAGEVSGSKGEKSASTKDEVNKLIDDFVGPPAPSKTADARIRE